MIDRKKIVFITLDWMKFYKGITDNDVPLGTGGTYPKELKHEVYNFLDENGSCYGYTPPYGKINIAEICKQDVKKNSDGNKYLENVLIVFNASKNDGNKRRVVGFYVGATIFMNPYPNTNPNRRIAANDSFASYNIRVKSEDAYLFDEENERTLYLPYSKQDGYGYGQSNIWYANKDKKSEDFKDHIIREIEKVVSSCTVKDFFDDEQKYFEGEVKTKTKDVFTISRNSNARKRCLDYYFPDNSDYKCLLCGFDFNKTYGALGTRFIEVHHIESHTTKSKDSGVHVIDPVKDLIPICSNCHSIIHREKPAVEIDKIKELFVK